MPFALLIIGVFLLVAGVRSTQDSLFSLVKSDFQGQDNFLYWFVAILAIGAVGYVPKLKPISTAFLVLVIVVLFLKKGNASGVGGGFFSQLLSGLGSTNAVGSSNDGLPIQNSSVPNTGNTLAPSANVGNALDALRQNLQQSISTQGLDLNAGLPQ